MKMEYKLLDNGTAVILTRQPELVYDNLYITFSGAPPDATAILETVNGSFYRKITERECSLPVKKLQGEVKVTVAILDGAARPRRWICEGIKATPQKDDGVLIAPNDMNLPQRFVEISLENQEIRRGYKEMREKYLDLEKRCIAMQEKIQKLEGIFDTNSLNFLI